MNVFMKRESRPEGTPMETRDGRLAEADWYYADLDGEPSVSFLARFRRGIGQRDARIQGPVTLAQLQQLASSGRVDRQKTMVWRPHWQKWQPAGEVQTLFAHQCPPPLPTRVFKRSLLFRGIENFIFLVLSIVVTIPLAIFAGLIKTGKFIKDRGAVVLGVRPIRPAGLAMGLHGEAMGEELSAAPADALTWLGRAAIISQAFICMLGCGVLASGFGDDMLPAYVFFWLANFAIWSLFIYRAWQQIPAKYQPTDERSMLYWMLVPGLSTYGWLSLIPELGNASYRIRNGGVPQPALPYRMSWVGTLMCFVPVLNIVGGMILVLWLVGVRRDLKATLSPIPQHQWN